MSLRLIMVGKRHCRVLACYSGTAGIDITLRLYSVRKSPMKKKRSPKSLMPPSRRHKRRISLLEIFLVAIETLWSNKVRSGLTMLGVIIGISSVIAITSIGQGVQKATELRIRHLRKQSKPLCS